MQVSQLLQNYVLFDKYQKNGTIYLKNKKPISSDLKERFDACEGELFLCNIPKIMSPETLLELTMTLGEVYLIRFKVDYNGHTRGFAYLIYKDPNLTTKAINELPKLFKLKNLKIPVLRSKNPKILKLCGVGNMKPLDVYLTLQKYIKFKTLCVYEVQRNKYAYNIVCQNNERAIFVRRELMQHIRIFGRKASINWQCASNAKFVKRTASCCTTYNKVLRTETEIAKKICDNQTCSCFKF